MNKCYENVKDFMLLGQPDMVAAELCPPKVTDTPFISADGLSDIAGRMTEASRDVRILVRKPHPTHLGLGLMLEELAEIIHAAGRGDLVEFADGLADLVYVSVWTAVAHGIDLPAVWAEVQRSNMAKFPTCERCGGSGKALAGGPETEHECPSCNGLGRVVVRDASGKVMKPPGWTPPDVAGALARQR